MDCCEKHEGHEKNQRHESGKKSEEYNHEAHEHEHASSNANSLNKHYIFLAIVGVLLIFSVVQAVQLSSARIDVAIAQATGSSIVGGTRVTSTSSSSASAPTMIGGC